MKGGVSLCDESHVNMMCRDPLWGSFCDASHINMMYRVPLLHVIWVSIWGFAL